ncbi:MAG TPA: hypothetical protein VJ260_07940 [Vicinamibacterales bacterium]|jgi:hypothetical protein|nr:hypothetical protein [Vicinamibacterales bacterium]
MELLRWTARIAGLIGIVLSIGACLSRLSGRYQLGSYQVLTVLQAGTTVMVLGCLLYLAFIAERRTS